MSFTRFVMINKISSPPQRIIVQKQKSIKQHVGNSNIIRIFFGNLGIMQKKVNECYTWAKEDMREKVTVKCICKYSKSLPGKNSKGQGSANIVSVNLIDVFRECSLVFLVHNEFMQAYNNSNAIDYGNQIEQEPDHLGSYVR